MNPTFVAIVHCHRCIAVYNDFVPFVVPASSESMHSRYSIDSEIASFVSAERVDDGDGGGYDHDAYCNYSYCAVYGDYFDCDCDGNGDSHCVLMADCTVPYVHGVH